MPCLNGYYERRTSTKGPILLGRCSEHNWPFENAQFQGFNSYVGLKIAYFYDGTVPKEFRSLFATQADQL